MMISDAKTVRIAITLDEKYMIKYIMHLVLMDGLFW